MISLSLSLCRTPLLTQLPKRSFENTCKNSNVSSTAFVTQKHVSFVPSRYDFVVVGLGAMGSSTLYHLAKAEKCVLGLEQFSVSHNMGSSHGLSRIIRLAYFENSNYVSMLRRAYKLWDDLQQETGRSLLIKTGSLDVGPVGSNVFQGSRYACEKESLQHEVMDRVTLISRFPGWASMRSDLDLRAVYQPDGGVLNPEQCVQAHIEMAKRNGAKVQEHENVVDIKATKDGDMVVKTNRGEYLCGRVVLSSGAWLGGFIRKCTTLANAPRLVRLASMLKPQRNVVTWYEAQKPELYQPNNFPVFVLAHGDRYFYGFPIINSGTYPFEQRGFKLGKYHHRYENLSDEMMDNMTWRTRFEQQDDEALNEAMHAYLETAHGPVLQRTACIFTNTPDEHFVVDACPDQSTPAVALVSACSGHGFKFSSMIGEAIAAQLTSNEYTHAPMDWLRATRFF